MKKPYARKENNDSSDIVSWEHYNGADGRGVGTVEEVSMAMKG